MTMDFDSGGNVTALDSGEIDLALIGEVVERRRYSHIWPRLFWKRQAFRLLRFLFTEQGKVGRWTRTWKCVWEVRLAVAPRAVCHRSADRDECVEWERRHFVV